MVACRPALLERHKMASSTVPQLACKAVSLVLSMAVSSAKTVPKTLATDSCNLRVRALPVALQRAPSLGVSSVIFQPAKDKTLVPWV
jgi:hypothetical protein